MRFVDRLLVCLYVAFAALPFVAMKLHAHDHALFGAIPPSPYPKRSAEAFLDESFQKAYTTWFESRIGFKGVAITTDNSLLYHVFGETKPGSSVRVGNGVLFHAEDIAYFNKNAWALPAPERVAKTADRIAELQRTMRAHGQALVPVLIPPKTVLYRDAIPDQWRRDLGEPRPAELAVYEVFRLALIARRVDFVDMQAIMLGNDYARDDLWRPYARHWSYYGACIAMKEIAKHYTVLTGRALPYECNLKYEHATRTHVDFDLLLLLNTWAPPHPVRLEPFAEHPPRETGESGPKALFIGTSFCWNLVLDAEHAHVFGKLQLDYYDKTLFSIPDNVPTEVHPNTAQWRAQFLGNDLYVLDLFEGYLLAPDDTYVDTFLSAMTASSSSPIE